MSCKLDLIPVTVEQGWGHGRGGHSFHGAGQPTRGEERGDRPQLVDVELEKRRLAAFSLQCLVQAQER